MKKGGSMILQNTNFIEMFKYNETIEVLEQLVKDEFSLEDIYLNLIDTPMIKAVKDNKVIGFITMERVNFDTLEIHFYIFKQYRKFTKEIIDSLYKLIFIDTSIYNNVVTSVIEDFKYVTRFLKMLGFKVTSETPNCVHKNGKPLSVTNLILRKEFYNG